MNRLFRSLYLLKRPYDCHQNGPSGCCEDVVYCYSIFSFFISESGDFSRDHCMMKRYLVHVQHLRSGAKEIDFS